MRSVARVALEPLRMRRDVGDSHRPFANTTWRTQLSMRALNERDPNDDVAFNSGDRRRARIEKRGFNQCLALIFSRIAVAMKADKGKRWFVDRDGNEGAVQTARARCRD